MVGIQEALAVSGVIDCIVPGGKEKHSLFCLGDIPGRAQEINSWFCTQESVLPGLTGPSRLGYSGLNWGWPHARQSLHPLCCLFNLSVTFIPIFVTTHDVHTRSVALSGKWPFLLVKKRILLGTLGSPPLSSHTTITATAAIHGVSDILIFPALSILQSNWKKNIWGFWALVGGNIRKKFP